MDAHPPVEQAPPLAIAEIELHWSALMLEFEEASQEVLASMHTHQTQGTQEALDALVRAQLRRSKALDDMLRLLDSLDDISKGSRKRELHRR